MQETGLNDFVTRNVPARCLLKSAVIEYAAMQRDLPVERVDDATILVRFPGATLPFVGLNGPDSSFVGKWLCDFKHAQRAIGAREGLPTTRSALFPVTKSKSALRFARSIGWPIVVKPNQLSRGRGVTVGVRGDEEFANAWRRALDAYGTGSGRSRLVVVEKLVEGEDFRLFVVDDRVVSATHKLRANVTGDGESTIADLIQRKNAARSGNPYLRYHPIPEDPAALDVLTAQHRSVSDVPQADERVTLRGVSNLWAGGDSVDVTDEIDPYYTELAIKAVRAMPGLAYGGVDIIALDISKAPDGAGGGHVLSEVEFSPAPMAHFPAVGEPRNMAGAIIDHYLAAHRWGTDAESPMMTAEGL